MKIFFFSKFSLTKNKTKQKIFPKKNSLKIMEVEERK